MKKLIASTPRHFAVWYAAVPIALAALGSGNCWSASAPQSGDLAPDFTLNTLDNMPVNLNHLRINEPVVLVVLRGWPGYQCPICTRQVGDFIAHSADFATQKAQVLMVYPGPEEP